ncbi:MAG TPA: hypothetical protein VKY62_12690 [Devosia sp.]|nr:hypothetical protein [Devosia sp.]
MAKIGGFQEILFANGPADSIAVMPTHPGSRLHRFSDRPRQIASPPLNQTID